MLKVCRFVVALALGLVMSLALLTSAVFAQSTQSSVAGKATQAVTATVPQTVNRTDFWGPGFRGGFFFNRGFFHPIWWGGGWGGWGSWGSWGGCW